jgi:hypothetical protein
MQRRDSAAPVTAVGPPPGIWVEEIKPRPTRSALHDIARRHGVAVEPGESVASLAARLRARQHDGLALVFAAAQEQAEEAVRLTPPRDICCGMDMVMVITPAAAREYCIAQSATCDISAPHMNFWSSETHAETLAKALGPADVRCAVRSWND